MARRLIAALARATVPQILIAKANGAIVMWPVYGNFFTQLCALALDSHACTKLGIKSTVGLEMVYVQQSCIAKGSGQCAHQTVLKLTVSIHQL